MTVPTIPRRDFGAIFDGATRPPERKESTMKKLAYAGLATMLVLSCAYADARPRTDLSAIDVAPPVAVPMQAEIETLIAQCRAIFRNAVVTRDDQPAVDYMVALVHARDRERVIACSAYLKGATDVADEVLKESRK